MTSNTQKNHLLIQKYIDQSIQPEELCQLQQLLTQDALFRGEFLQYVQVEISIEDMVLFHNYMDAPNSLSKESPSAQSLAKESLQKKLEQKQLEAKVAESQFTTTFPSRFHEIFRRFLVSLCSLPKL